MRADDLRAVLDGAGSERAVLFGDGDGGSLAALFAAMHPDRVLALVLYNSWARTAWAPDYPMGCVEGGAGGAGERRSRSTGGREELATRFLESVSALVRERSGMGPVGGQGSASRRLARRGARLRRGRARDRRPERLGDRAGTDPVLSRSAAAHARAADLAERIPGARYVHSRARTGCPTPGTSTPSSGRSSGSSRSVSAEEATFDRVLDDGALHRHRRLDREGWRRSATARGRCCSNGTTRPSAR